MTLTKKHTYADQDGDSITMLPAYPSFPIALRVAEEADGDSAAAYVDSKFAAPLALNILGHDRPDDDPLATKFSVGQSTAWLAQAEGARNDQLDLAAALLMAVDGYDQRAVRLATAEERRNRAAQSLTDTVIKLRNDGPGPFTGDEIGKLREALGRFDAALAN